VADPNLVVLPDEAAVAREAAARLVAALAQAIRERGVAHVALTGGSSAVSLFRQLRDPHWRQVVDWRRVHLWWGDERLVPIDHPDSNIGLAYNILLELPALTGESGTGGEGVDVASGDLPALPFVPENVHPYEVDEAVSGSEPAQLVAQRYAEQLERYLPAVGALPGFDVILLGVGPDGHILSIFPGSEALKSEELVVAVPAPGHVPPHLERVSLNPRLLPAAGVILVMVSGAAKAGVMAEVLGTKHDPATWPAQLALLPQTAWLLDKAAAAEIQQNI
jgi:6-phosphogluconolactonase